MSIQDYLKKKKKEKEADGLDVNRFVLKQSEEITDKFLANLKPEIVKDVKNVLNKEIEKSKKVRDKIVDMQSKIKKGDKGDSIKGDKGDIGKSIVGSKGDPGKIGTPGKNGESIKGDKGDTGKDGSPDKPEDIAKKLNTLTEKVEPKVIKGFESIIRLLQRQIRAVKSDKLGGGGMGNVQHETFSVNSSTTSVTVSQGIAGGGFAIWAHYQGQLVMRGTHYTVSGKTLSLTFTPDDDTFIDIIYMRG